jgi:hypothetical protein
MSVAQSLPLVSKTETTSIISLGQFFFKLSGLTVKGQQGEPTFPEQIAPQQSPSIVRLNEEVEMRVDVECSDNPFSRMVLCQGLRIEAQFPAEGIGGIAAEVDLSTMTKTKANTFRYTLTVKGTPEEFGMKPGLYFIGAVVSIRPADDSCVKDILGSGYIAARLLQVQKEA